MNLDELCHRLKIFREMRLYEEYVFYVEKRRFHYNWGWKSKVSTGPMQIVITEISTGKTMMLDCMKRRGIVKHIMDTFGLSRVLALKFLENLSESIQRVIERNEGRI